MNLFKRVGIAIAFQLFFLCHTMAQSYSFTYSPACLQAMDAIHKLQIQKARNILSTESIKTPNNLATDYLSACADYYELITTADKTLMDKLEKFKANRLSRIQKLTPTNIQASYAEAEIVLQWGLIKLMHQEYVTGAIELRSALQLHQKNLDHYPSFLPTYKSLGFIKSILGTLPENYNWILNIVGLKGNLKEGILLIEKYINQTTQSPELVLSNQQANYYYILLQFYFGNKTTAYNYTQSHTLDYQENTLSCYLRAFVAARNAKTDESIAVLNKRPRGDEYLKYYDLDFYMGFAKLNKLDLDAEIEFKKFVTFSQNKSLKKDAYRRLSWSSLIQNDTLRFETYRHLAFTVSSYRDDEDILVEKELGKHIYPNIPTLKARLLFDGGYYSQAEEILKSVQPAQLRGIAQQAEYYYRYGRIMQEQKKYAKAIELFSQAIKLAETTGLYFAPYSALQLGVIYARLGYAQTASFYYNKAIGYKNYKDQGYITQKARQALSELPGEKYK
jgi:hypothetical protein